MTSPPLPQPLPWRTCLQRITCRWHWVKHQDLVGLELRHGQSLAAPSRLAGRRLVRPRLLAAAAALPLPAAAAAATLGGADHHQAAARLRGAACAQGAASHGQGGRASCRELLWRGATQAAWDGGFGRCGALIKGVDS